jgi:hypothetical protein
MKKHLFMIVFPLAAFFLLQGNCFAQQQQTPPLKAGDVLSELSQEARINMLRGNMINFVLNAMKLAKEKNMSPQEFGTITGKHFVPNWPNTVNVTPEEYVRGMNANWQMFGVKLEILKADENEIRYKHGRIAKEESFDKAYMPIYGLGLKDIEVHFKFLQQGMAASFDLVYDEYRDGEFIFATIARKKVTAAGADGR